jgi:hypothetical protein
MALVVALGLLVALAVVMLVFVGIERGPEPVDVAVAYELAWRRHDYATLFDLSAKELRDGLARDEFVAAKRAGDARAAVARGESHPHAEPAPSVAVAVRVDEILAATDSALVVTRAEGEDLRHRVMCERRHGRWQVVGYNLVTSDP